MTRLVPYCNIGFCDWKIISWDKRCEFKSHYLFYSYFIFYLVGVLNLKRDKKKQDEKEVSKKIIIATFVMQRLSWSCRSLIIILIMFRILDLLLTGLTYP